MTKLEKARIDAADHLTNAINTFVTCDNPRVQRSIVFHAVDAIIEYSLEALLLNLYNRADPKHPDP